MNNESLRKWLETEAGQHCYDMIRNETLGLTRKEIIRILELAFTAGQTSQAKEDKELIRAKNRECRERAAFHAAMDAGGKS